MEFRDDELEHFATHGAAPLPPGREEGHVEHDGAHIWYASFGAGPAVILLHGGLGHGGNWGYQVPALLAAGYQAVLMDSRGHGHSSRDEQPYSYDRMAGDVLGVMDGLKLEKAALVGWSDGACIALILADKAPERVAGVFFFACNMDPGGTKELQPSVALDRCFARHGQDYAALSPTPDEFEPFVAAVTQMMKTQPNYTAQDLARIRVPVTISQGEHEEFIRLDHAEYLARSIPGARLVILPGVSHFAPLQRPALFNQAMLTFVSRVFNAPSPE
ncbi:alpha/beta fold hydrolase [Labrys okinawensis]|uniref:alpha/beta fold hydrolase n=1 Tax=Labrys okinawensis TaxID=346911 RepID=UPI0039BC6886